MNANDALYFVGVVKLFSSFLQVFGFWLHSFLTRFQCSAMSFFCLFWSSLSSVSLAYNYGKGSWEIAALPPFLKIQPSSIGKVHLLEIKLHLILISASLRWSCNLPGGALWYIFLILPRQTDLIDNPWRALARFVNTNQLATLNPVFH